MMTIEGSLYHCLYFFQFMCLLPRGGASDPMDVYSFNQILRLLRVVSCRIHRVYNFREKVSLTFTKAKPFYVAIPNGSNLSLIALSKRNILLICSR